MSALATGTKRSTWLVAVLVAAIACTTVTGIDGGPDSVRRYCILKGDTVGVIKQSDGNGKIAACLWQLSMITSCGQTVVDRHPISCVVGGPYPGAD
jgi:hypothetical protein